MPFSLPRHFPLLPRNKNSEKQSFGHLLVIAGSASMPGAAVLTTLAALRSGAGLVTLAAPASLFKTLRGLRWEAMRLPLSETQGGAMAPPALKVLSDFAAKRRISAIALGPGLSHGEGISRLVRRLTASSKVPVVLDADGLNCFKGRAAHLKRHHSAVILTPHRGEFERLFSKKLPKALPIRIALAKKLSKLYDVLLVIKGHRTLVVQRDKVYVNGTGNPGMAKGGSGDVLTGILGAFLCQGLSPFEACVWAVYFHGKAGDIAVRKKGELALLPGDLVDSLSKAFARR